MSTWEAILASCYNTLLPLRAAKAFHDDLLVILECVRDIVQNKVLGAIGKRLKKKDLQRKKLENTQIPALGWFFLREFASVPAVSVVDNSSGKGVACNLGGCAWEGRHKERWETGSKGI